MAINVGSAEGYIDLNTSGFSSGLANALLQLKQFQASAEGMGQKLQDFGKSFSSIGEKMTIGITTPLVGLGTAVMKTTADFEAKMSGVKATLGAGTDDMKQLHDEAIKLGADTAFSASEAAEGMENLASAGFNTQEIMGAMPGMLNLAAAGDLSIADASDIASSSLRGFGLQASDSAHVADVFAQVAADTNAQVSDLGEAMKYAAPVAHGFGLNIEETSAAIGEMANAGIKGSQAGTTLRSALTSLANPSKQASEAMQSIGFNAFDAQGKMLPLPQLIGNLQKSMSGLTQQQKEQKLATIFGTEALSGMQVLVEQGPDALKKEEDALKSCTGAAQQMGNTKMDNLKGSVEQLKGSMETFGISIGEIVTPALRKLIDSITDTVNSFNNMSNSQKTMVLSFAAVAASMGPHLVILGKLTEGVGKFYTNIGSASKTLSEFGEKTQSSFNKASTSFNVFSEGIKKFGSNLGITNNDIKLFGNLLQTGVSEKLSPITSKVNSFSNGFKSAMDKAFLALPTGMQKGITGISTGVSTIISRFTQLGSLVAGPLASFGSKVTSSLTSLMGVALKIFLPATIVAGLIVGLGAAYQQFGSQIDQMIQMVTTKGPTIITNLANGITQKIPFLMASGAAILVKIVEAITANLPALGSAAANILSTLVNSLASNLPALIPAAISLIQTIATTIINNLPKIIESGLNLLVALAQGISNNSAKIVDTIVKVLTTLINVIAQHLPQIIEAGIKILVALIQGLSKALPQLVGYIPTIISSIFNAFSHVNWGSIGSNIIHGIISGIKAVGSGIGQTLENLAGSALSAIKKKLGIHSPSRVFHDEVGIQIGAGIATGITDSAPQLMQATVGYVDLLNKTFNDQLTTTVDVINNKAIGISAALTKAVTPETTYRAQLWEDMTKGTETYDTALNKLKHTNDMLSVSTGNAQSDLRNILGEMTNLSTMAVIARNQYQKLGNSIGWTANETQNALKEYQDAQKGYLELGQKAIEAQQALRDNQYDEAYEVLDAKIKQLSEDTGDSEDNLINQQKALELLKEKAAGLTTQYQELLDKYGEFDDKVKSAKKDIDDNTQAINDMNKTIQDTQEKLEDTSVDSLNNLFDKLKSSLKDYYDDMEKQQEASVQANIDANDKWKENTLSNLEKVYNAKKDEISKEKTLLERSNSDQDDQDKINEDNKILSMNYSAKKKAEVEKDLNDTIKEMNRRHQSEQLDDQSDALEKQYNTDKDNIEAIAKQNDDYYNSQLSQIKSFYESKESEAQLDAQAEKLIASNNQKEIVTLLKSYGEDYELAGASLGERLVNGMKSQLYSIQEIFDAVTRNANNIIEKTSSMNTPSVSLNTVSGSNWKTTQTISETKHSFITQTGPLINVEHMDASKPQDIQSLAQALQFVVDQQNRAKGGSIT